jgi:hypothetical protein
MFSRTTLPHAISYFGGTVTASYICVAYLKLEYNGLDWMHLLQDRDKGRGFVKTLMNRRVPQIAANFFTS